MNKFWKAIDILLAVTVTIICLPFYLLWLLKEKLSGGDE